MQALSATRRKEIVRTYSCSSVACRTANDYQMTPQQRGEHGGAVHFYFQGDAAAGRSWGCARGCMPKHRSASFSHSILSDFRGLLQLLLWVQLIPNSSAFVPLATGRVGETVSYEYWKFAFVVKSMKTSCPKHFWEMQLCQNSLFYESTSNSGKQSHVRKRQWNLSFLLTFFFFWEHSGFHLFSSTSCFLKHTFLRQWGKSIENLEGQGWE